MDFKRIELIFLVAFLSLNIFLVYTITQGRDNPLSTTATDLSYNLEKKLAEDSVDHEGKISKEQMEGYYLSGIESMPENFETGMFTGQIYYFDGSQLNSEFQSRNPVLVEVKNPEKALNEVIHKEENIAFGREYSYLKGHTQTDNQFLYTQVWEGIPIIDETAELIINLKESSTTELRVADYQQTHLEEIEPLREKQSLISEYDALRTLYLNNKLPTKSKIKSCKLGYTRIFTVRGKNVYNPAWFVEIETNKNNTQMERVNAVTNTILTSGVSEVKN